MGKVNIIVAASSNMVIGKDNSLPWHLPSDLKYFKKLTQGSIVVMGRKCWDSLPEKSRPLRDRLNVVLTRNPNIYFEGGVTINSLDSFLEDISFKDSDDVFLIGGSEVYKQAFKYATKLYLTRILDNVEGDKYLEGFDVNEWTRTKTSDIIEENGFNFVFEEYVKK